MTYIKEIFAAMNTSDNSFDLQNDQAYEHWRAEKLGAYPYIVKQHLVTVNNPARLDAKEKSALSEQLDQYNFAVFQARSPETVTKACIQTFGRQFGLEKLDSNLCADDDAITSITVTDHNRGNAYIPYSNKPLSWHTDGYYNSPEQTIFSWVLYCAQDAATGGESELLDQEIAYILLRDEDPALIAKLSELDVMTIPPNIEDGIEIRGETTGPVFTPDTASGHLHMRYSARKRNIEWQNNEVCARAVESLAALFKEDNPYIIRHRLSPGSGVISRNVLHRRTGFTDSKERKRLVYRARYLDRIQTS